MIQHANDPKANRADWRPTAPAKDAGAGTHRARAWPFLSKPVVQRPLAQDAPKTPRNDSDSGS